MKKTAVITGGTKGIGRALVEIFLHHQFDVFTNSRSEKELNQLKNELESEKSGSLFIQKADFVNPSEVVQFAIFVKENTDHINVLINNAGIFLPGQISNEEAGLFEKMMQINLSSVYHLTRLLLPKIAENREGYIFNMCSTASFVPYTNGGSYCISKFGLLGLTKVLREELKAREIAVSAVMPGATLTASWEGSDFPESRFMNAKDVAFILYNAWNSRKTIVMEELIIRPYGGDL
jgi:short-subunit dehydrogenase